MSLTKKLILLSVVALFVIIGMSPKAFAATYKDIGSKSNVEASKVWNIKFSSNVDKSSINTNNIVVLDSKSEQVPIKLVLKDSKTVSVSPLSNYTPGETYRLIVKEGVVSEKGTKIKLPAKMEFTIKKPADTTDPLKGAVVALDAGRVNNATGYVVGPTGVKGKDINIAVTKKVGSILKSKGVQVVYTGVNDDISWTKNDSFDARSKIINAANPDLFVSINTNSATSETATGSETYYLPGNENGKNLSTIIQDELFKKTGLKNRGAKEASKEILTKVNATGAYVYLGFINNPTEEKVLVSEDFQNKSAEAIADAIINYLSNNKGPSTNNPSNSEGKIKIALDAGHGGPDSGAVGPNGVKEKDVTLAVTFKLGDILKKNGIEVVYTRTNDTDTWLNNKNTELATRAKIANDAKVDYFVSIHCNSFNETVSGTETLYHESSTKGKVLATNIQKEIIAAFGSNDRGAKADVRGLYVLENTDAPAVLVELEFISNPQKEAMLNNPTYQQKYAEAIAKGILETLNK